MPALRAACTTDDRVLEYQTVLGRDTEAERREQVDLRVGFSAADVFGGDDDGESITQPAFDQERLDVVARGRCRDRPRHAARGQLADERRDAVDQRRSGAGEAAIVLLLARGQPLRLGHVVSRPSSKGTASMLGRPMVRRQ
jgi:hypothetical protein